MRVLSFAHFPRTPLLPLSEVPLRCSYLLFCSTLLLYHSIPCVHLVVLISGHPPTSIPFVPLLACAVLVFPYGSTCSLRSLDTMNPYAPAPPLDPIQSSSSGDITPPPILTTPNLSTNPQHTPHSSIHRPVLSPNYHIGNIQKPVQYPHIAGTGQYLPSGGLNLSGVAHVEGLNDLEAMKVGKIAFI